MTKLTKLVLVLFFAFALCHISWAQSRTISGTVSDNNGNPLFRATVAVKNSKAVTLTDQEGKFSLKLPDNATTLVVSNVGTATKEVPIGTGSVFAVVLHTSGVQMSDVVVVGYGVSKRANLTTAQTSVNAKAIEKTVNTTVEQALQGRAAGVYVTQNSGQPGGGMSVNIRGISTLNSRTQPLYVIDDIQVQIENDVNYGNSSSSNALAGLNPADIEDIQILEGPSATAIYGSRGTNGVVLITTKRGKAGDFKVNYGYNYSLQTPPDNLSVMNLSQYASMVKQYHAIAGGTTPAEFLDSSLLGAGTDWQAALFNNAAMNKHQLNLSGGSGATTYYLSGEYMDQDGVAAGSGFKRYGTRLNLDSKPKKWLNLGTNLSFNQTDENLTTTNYGDAQSPLIANALRLTPQIPVTNFDGSWGGSDPVNGANQYAPINPIALANLITNKNMKRQFMGGVNVSIMPVKGLTIRSSLNGSFGNGLSTYYTPTYNIDQWHYNTVASLTTGTYSSYYWNWNELVEYAKQIGKHNFTAMVSHEAQESKYQALSAGRTGFLTNDVFDVNAGDPLSATNSGGIYLFGIESYLGRLTYNYDNRYLIASAFRRDGSPNFGSNKRWGNFPSLSVAWRVSQEKFFDIPWMSELKLRYETGSTGNSGNSSNAVYAPLATGATPWGTGFLPSTYTNPDFQWEETKSNNFGLNLGFIHNRITVDANYYVRNISNLMMNASAPDYMGTNSSPGSLKAPLVNTGSMQTKGWDFTINASIIDHKDFRWDANLNISHYKSTIKYLNNNQPFLERTSWWMNNWTQRSTVGLQPWLFRGYVEDGLFQSVADINKSPVPVDNNGNRIAADPQTGIWVGDVKYKDLNGDGKITVADMTDIGNPWPKLTGGLTNTFSYKGFELSMLIIGTYGNQVYNYIAADASNPNNINLSRNLLVKAMEYAKIDSKDPSNPKLINPETSIPRISNNQIASDNNYAKITNRFVEDGSYLRLKNISLTYDVPAKWLGYTKVIRNLRVTVGAQNVLTLTHYHGYDPEVGSYVGTGSSTDNQAIGIDFGRYPLTRMYNAAVSVNF